jgi:hypothetical protein
LTSAQTLRGDRRNDATQILKSLLIAAPLPSVSAHAADQSIVGKVANTRTESIPKSLRIALTKEVSFK